VEECASRHSSCPWSTGDEKGINILFGVRG
jgi:hypothetical protein